MITNPETHQRSLGGRGKKREGAEKRERENAKLKYSATSEGRNKTGLDFVHVPRDRQRGARERQSEVETDEDKRQTAQEGLKRWMPKQEKTV